jgi:hypothetical protein
VSFFAGSSTIVRYRVFGIPPKVKLSDITSAMTPRALGKIRLTGDSVELRYGWTYTDHMDLGPEIRNQPFDLSFCRTGTKLLFAMRVEQRRVSQKLAREVLQDRLAQVASESGGHPQRGLKKKLQTEIKMELLKNALPSISSTEILWDLDTGSLWLSKPSTKIIECFERLFHDCFSERLGFELCPLILPNIDGAKSVRNQSEYLSTLHSVAEPITSSI